MTDKLVKGYADKWHRWKKMTVRTKEHKEAYDDMPKAWEKPFSKEHQEAFNNALRKEKPKAIILDDNELSISKYAEEYPDNFEKMTEEKGGKE